MNSSVSPIRESERLPWIDAARGLAILGIFMVNVPAFNAPYFLYGGAATFWPSDVSQVVQILIDIFFQASFYTLFSFLFGFGIQMTKDRLTDKQVPYRALLFRRLLLLIGFGLVHAFVIWHGDILLSYGCFGLILFAFFHVSRKALLGWAYGMLAVLVVPATLMFYTVRDQLTSATNKQAMTQAQENYSHGSIIDIWQQNLTDWWYVNQPANLPFLALGLIPMFLFGMYIGRKRWLHSPESHLPSIKKWWGITGVIFATFKAGPYAFGNPQWTQLMQDHVGGTASAVFYVLSIVLLFRSYKGSRILFPLTWVGRMSLSNYIFQSFISFLLFYSVGFGLYGQMSPLMSAAMVLVVFTLQIFISRMWLQRYRMGPLEWLWRTMTYRRKQPL